MDHSGPGLIAWLHGLHYRGQPLRRGGLDGDFLKTLSTGRLSGLDHVVHQQVMSVSVPAFQVCQPANQAFAATNQLRFGFLVSHFLGLDLVEDPGWINRKVLEALDRTTLVKRTQLGSEAIVRPAQFDLTVFLPQRVSFK